MIDLINILASDRKQILYRPELNEMTGSVTATILFQQILFRWDHNDRKPFYKFKSPCKHNLYRVGDSWTEEIGFTKYEFDGAIKRIAKKVKKNLPKPTNCLVWYWTTIERVTYYEINQAYLSKSVFSIYEERKSHFTKNDNSNLDNTENTTEITTKNTKSEATTSPSDFSNSDCSPTVLKPNEAVKKSPPPSSAAAPPKEKPLQHQLMDAFSEQYLKLTKSDFVWTGKEIKGIQQLGKILTGRFEKRKGQKAEPGNVVACLNAYLEQVINLEDDFWLSNFTPSMLNGSFNKIVASLAAAKKSKKSKSQPKVLRDDRAMTEEEIERVKFLQSL